MRQNKHLSFNAKREISMTRKGHASMKLAKDPISDRRTYLINHQLLDTTTFPFCWRDLQLCGTAFQTRPFPSEVLCLSMAAELSSPIK